MVPCTPFEEDIRRSDTAHAFMLLGFVQAPFGMVVAVERQKLRMIVTNAREALAVLRLETFKILPDRRV